MRRFVMVATCAAVFGAVACTSDNTRTVSDPPGTVSNTTDAVVLSVVPSANATGVNPADPIVVNFNHAMMTGMELLVALHEGSITGPQIAGTAKWSTDRTQLTFTPSAVLKSKTTYVLNLAPNLVDTNGKSIDYSACASSLGGSAVTATMWNAMMDNGGMMGGGMMGNGWQAGSGTWGYGMFFTFVTA